VTVAVALVAYDVVRTEPEAPTDMNEAVTVDTSALEDRLDALESDRRRTRRPGGPDQGVLARLAALESATPARGATVAPDATPVPNDEVAAAAMGDAASSNVVADEPTKSEIARFRRLAAAVRKEDTLRKNVRRVDRLLDALPINLSDEQRDGVHSRWASFQPRIREIWGEAKQEAQRTSAAGDEVDTDALVADTQAVIQNEFAGLLGGLIAPAESATIAEALTARGK